MITPEKSYSNNPFVDNIIYYAKMIAMNCTVKDEEEALKNETKESLYAGDVLIACVEGKAHYEMFDKIPIEIIEKYVQLSTNLDIYAAKPENLKTRLNHFNIYNRNRIFNKFSSLARTVYIDHFDIMTDYVEKVGPTWLMDNLELYTKCVLSKATYEDLFDVLPIETVMRIIKKYLNSHGYCDLISIWDPSQITVDVLSDLAIQEALLNGKDPYMANTIVLDTDYLLNTAEYDDKYSDFMNQFKLYIKSRSDNTINTELDKISNAMRQVFISHYEMMRDRGYFSTEFYHTNIDEYYSEIDFASITDERFLEILKNGSLYKNKTEPGYNYIYTTADGREIDLTLIDPAWMGFYYERSVYNKCVNGKATYYDLYNLFPSGERNKALVESLGLEDTVDYNLNGGDVEVLKIFFEKYCEDSNIKRRVLDKKMREMYIANYQLYLNNDVYLACKNEEIDFYELYKYLPKETIKSIINTEIEETTNIEVYASSKELLNSYLNTLSRDEANRIKDAITKDMISWYPSNHVETNNYYRALIGLPPMDSKGNVYEDTLLHTYDSTSESFIEFGNKFLSMVTTSIYPVQHWKNELYKFDSYDISILNEYGVLDDYLAYGCKSSMYTSRYKYLRYLGDEKLDLYTCRKAENFSIIGMPSVDNMDIYNKFLDAFTINSDYIVRAIYSDAYKFNSDYYNKFIIIFILFNTIMDMLTGIPDLIINRDVFDARCIKYLFEANGIPYYGEIPIKYQQAMLKNLNILIKYKSSTKNMVDICKLFGFNDVKVFGYYLMKDRNTDIDGNYLFNDDTMIHYTTNNVYVLDPAAGPITDVSGRRFSTLSDYRYFDEDYYLKEISVTSTSGNVTTKKIINNDRTDLFIYDEECNEMIPLKETYYFKKIKADTTPASLKFVQVPINETITDYKNDSNRIFTYDDIAWEQTWDGGLDHEYLANKILDYEFNAVKSKYISIDTVTSLTEMAYQTSYFYSMLFDNIYSEDLLTLTIPSISQNHKFRLADIIFYLFALTYFYSNMKDNIMYSPSQILYVKGYNFDETLNTLIQDERHFTQYDNYGNALEDYEKKNIFDINERIKKEKYDYLDRFNTPEYYIKGFNLEANIDSLEKWLNDEWQISLSDLVVSEDTEEFGQVITLMQFYSLNNSYYQKDIFNGDMIPTQYNNVIKYAYDYNRLKKVLINDINDNAHAYIKEIIKNTDSSTLYNFLVDIVAVVSKSRLLYTYDELMDRLKKVTSISQLENYAYILTNIFGVDNEEQLVAIEDEIETPYYNEIINNTSDTIYVLDNYIYAYQNGKDPLAVYHKYNRNDNGDFILDSNIYYIPDNSEEGFGPLINGNIYIKNSAGMYIFAAPKYYSVNSNGEYKEITNEINFIYDNGTKILKYGDYYIIENDRMVLNPDNCYIYISIDGVWQYILLKDVENYTSLITDSDCYIRHDDGHFVRFDYTDYYIRTHKDTEMGNEMVYTPEDLYVISNKATEFYDPSVTPRVYYTKLSEYYINNDYITYRDTLYVKDSYGNYIPENELVSPNNCWYYDYDNSEYKLVANNLYNYDEYSNPRNVLYILVLQNNFDYYKYALDGNGNYRFVEIPNKRYIVDSDQDYIDILDELAEYKDTNKLIVVFNKSVTENMYGTLKDDEGYNPSLHDNIWDENDWFYADDSYDEDIVIGMNGENIWYYRKPGSGDVEVKDDSLSIDAVGSGFYIDSGEYIKDITLTKGETYYMSFDIETNFNGIVQLYNEADPSVTTTNIRAYDVRSNEVTHINQIFVANDNTTPSIMILKYNFDVNPINIGDYCIISNLKFSKSFSNDFIANDIPSYDELLRIYKTNEAIYKFLMTKMRQTTNKKTYDMYKKLYDSLMITKYNKEIFKIGEDTYAITYTEFLQYRDEILYDKLEYYKTIDIDTMRSMIANEVLDITYALDEAINKDGKLSYIYSYFPAVSMSFVQNYIYKIVNWFKSWKVHLLGINTLYRMGNGVITDANGNIIAEYDGDEYNVKLLYDEQYRIKLPQNQKDGFIYNELKINPYDANDPAGMPYKDKFDIEEYTDRLYHHVGLKDRIRIITKTADIITYEGYDNEEMHIHLNDDTTKVTVLNGNILKITTINGDEFYPLNTNEAWMSTDEDPQYTFASQFIDEINLLSGDYIEYDEEDDDDYE